MFGYYLVFHFAAYFILCGTFQVQRVKKAAGIDPVVVTREPVQAYVYKISRILTLMGGFSTAAYAFSPRIYRLTGPLTYLQAPTLRILGLALLLISFAWTFKAQFQMGKSWRVGFDPKQGTELVSQGLFRYSRNPIFAGMIVTVLGLFLVTPNAFTLVVFITGTVIVNVQVRLEEAYLLGAHGKAYEEYCAGVRRWI